MATGYTVTGDTGSRLPDILPELTKGAIPTSNALAEWWGPGRKSALNPYDAKAQDLDTLVERYAGFKSQQFSQMVVFPIMTGGNYATKVCPMERSNGINIIYSRTNYQGSILDPAPELSAPNYVTHTSEKHESTLERFNKAARITGDFYKTPEGRQVMEDMTIQLTFAAWTLVISMFELNVVKAKRYWQDWMLEYGVKCNSFHDAVMDEIEQFGMFNKDDKAIYKLWAYVKKTMTTYTPTLAVFKQGVTDFLALTGDFETNPQMNGMVESKSRLMQAGNGLKGTFSKVLDIYETVRLDHQYNDNLDALSNWERLVCFGRCAIMCGQEQRGCYNGSNPVCKLENLYDLEHISMDIDAWKVLKIKEVWKKSMRFDDKGNLHPYLLEFLGEIHDVAQNTGVQIVNNQVDPYVWYSPSDFTDEGEHLNNGGYHAIKYWGDMEPRYFTMEQNVEHGEIGARVIQCSQELSAEDYKNMTKLEGLRKELANPPNLDVSVVGSVLLVEMMSQNKNALGSRSGIVKRGGMTGAPELPFRVQDKKFKDLYFLSDSEKGKDQKALWVIYQDNARYVTWHATASDTERGVRETKFANSGLGTQNPNIENEYTLALPDSLTDFIEDEEVPIAYILAPLNAFGPIDEEDQRERIFNVNGNTEVDQEYIDALSQSTKAIPKYLNPLLPTKYKIEKAIEASGPENATNFSAYRGLNNLTIGSTNIDPVTLIGGKRARLVRAPSVPYGWAGISHIHELANRYKEGGRGWMDTTKVAYEGLESRKKYDQKLRGMYPDNALINSMYCPEFMKTHLTRVNEDYALDVNVIHGPENPIFSRISMTQAPLLFGTNSVGVYTPSLYPIEIFTSPGVVGHGVVNFPENSIIEGLTELGFVNPRSNDYRPRGVESSKYGSFINLFYQILNDEQVPVSFKESFFNQDQRADSWNKTYQRLFSTSYNDLLKTEGNDSDVMISGSALSTTKIAYFFMKEIYGPYLEDANSESDISKGAGMFGTFLKMIESSTNLKKANPMSRRYIDTLANASKSKKRIRDESKKYKSYEADKNQGRKSITNTRNEEWINTTLVFDNSIFASMAKSALSSSKNKLVTRLALLPISPADPENPHMPLFRGTGRVSNAGNVINQGVPNIAVAKLQQPGEVKNYIKALQHAKLKFGVENLDYCAKDKKYETQLPLHLQPYPEGSLKVSIDNFEDNIHERLTFDATESEFVTQQDVINDRGEILPGKSMMVKRVHLAKRWKRLGKMSNDFARHCAQLLCFTRVTRQSLENWLDHGLPTPDDTYIFAQPFNLVVASFGLFSVEGAGRTFFNYEDAALYFDGNHKLWEIHFSAWFGIVFPLPEGMMIVKDIMWHGFKSGMTDDVYCHPNEFVSERIEFKDKCGFFFTCGSSFSRTIALKTAHPLPLYGRWLSSSIPTNVVNRSSLLQSRAPLWPSFLYYAFIWRFPLMISKYGIIDTTSYLAEKQQTTINGNMYHMRTRARNPNTGRFEVDCEGYGHLGTLDPPLRARFAGKITTRLDKKL